jgi:hypothetical protein
MAEQPNTLPPDIHMATVIPGDAQNPDGVGPFFPEPDLSGGLPINLDSLRDGPPGSKPFYPYSTLIRCVFGAHVCNFGNSLVGPLFRYAIKGSPTGKLLLEDIYYAIESRVYPFHPPDHILTSQRFAAVPLLPHRTSWLEGESRDQTFSIALS